MDADIEREKQLNQQRKAQIMQGAAEQAEINSKAIAAAGEAEAKTLVENASKSEEHLREEMKSRVSAETMQKVAAITAEVLRKGDFSQSKQALNDRFIEQIKELVSAMPSDILNMNELKKLDISIKSAEPLSDEEMKKLADHLRDLHLLPQ